MGRKRRSFSAQFKASKTWTARPSVTSESLPALRPTRIRGDSPDLFEHLLGGSDVMAPHLLRLVRVPLIDYPKYRSLMFGDRTSKDVVHEEQLSKKGRAELEGWLKGREADLLREVSAGATASQWEPYRARAALELLQAAEFWRDAFGKRSG
jgi:hypothetical protein